MAIGSRDKSALMTYPQLLRIMEHCWKTAFEDVVRDLYRCFGVLGDVDALVEEQQRLHAALRRSAGPDEDPDPEPATAALFARIRQDLELKATVPA